LSAVQLCAMGAKVREESDGAAAKAIPLSAIRPKNLGKN